VRFSADVTRLRWRATRGLSPSADLVEQSLDVFGGPAHRGLLCQDQDRALERVKVTGFSSQFDVDFEIDPRFPQDVVPLENDHDRSDGCDAEDSSSKEFSLGLAAVLGPQ